MSIAATEELALIDRVLDSWAVWARNSGLPLCSHSSLRYTAGRNHHSEVLPLSDDKFGLVDRAVARLHIDARAIIHVHYCRRENESASKKAEACGVSLRHYRAALTQAQLDVLESLQPDIYCWA